MSDSDSDGEEEGTSNRGHTELSHQKKKIKRERSSENLATCHLLKGNVVGETEKLLRSVRCVSR